MKDLDSYTFMFYNDFTEEELKNFPPLPKELVGCEEYVSWNGEEWEYIPMD